MWAHGRGRWILGAIAPVMLVAAAAGAGPAAAAAVSRNAPAAAVAAAATGCKGWAGSQPAGNGNASVAVLSPCDAWAVGTGDNFDTGGDVLVTVIQHWNGNSWATVPSPNPGTQSNALHAIAAVSPTDIWAVGDFASNSTQGTLILHWDGNSWTQVPSPSPGADFSSLDSVSAASADDVWAVGTINNDDGVAHTLVTHWDGISWAQVSAPSSGSLFSVTATSASDAWAVGTVDDGTTATPLALHWDGTAWAPAAVNLRANAEFTSVAAASPTAVWAAGRQATQQGVRTLLMRWTGSRFDPVPSPNPDNSPGNQNVLGSVAVTSATNAWAAGSYTTNGSNLHRRTLLVHWNGTSWARVATPNPGDTDQLVSLAATPAGDAWGIGQFGNVTTGEAFGAFAFHAAPAGCHAVAGAAPASPGNAGQDLRGVAVLSACNAWAVGSSISSGSLSKTLIEHYDGSSWTAQPSPDRAGSNDFLTSVSAVSPTDIWAVGFSGSGSTGAGQTLTEHWNGSSWSIVPSPSIGSSSHLNGVRAISASDVWAVGGFTGGGTTRTLILHWNGSTWVHVLSPSPRLSDDLAGVSATASNDVWAVGHFAGSGPLPLILHWDGSTWSHTPISSSAAGTLSGVAANNADDAWAVGRSGTQTLILRWNGSRWTRVASSSPGVSSQLNGVTNTFGGTAWAVGVTNTGSANEALLMHWSGGVWSVEPGLGPAGTTLFAASSSSGSSAWAVGGLFLSPNPGQTFALRCC